MHREVSLDDPIFDDLSSLGDENSVATLNAKVGGLDTAYIEVDDFIAARPDKDEFAELEDADHAISREKHKIELLPYVVDDFYLNPEYVSIINPLEFEEVVAMFNFFDVNKDGAIDKFEARKILFSLDQDASLSLAENLLRIINYSQLKDLTFEDFCRFIVMLHHKVPSVVSYLGILDQISNSVLGKLEYQSNLRNLVLKFYQVENRRINAPANTVQVTPASLTSVQSKESAKLCSN